jgi:glutathione peroxidase
MKKSTVFPMFALAIAALAGTLSAEEATPQTAKSPLEFKMNSLAGKEIDLEKYRGKVVLIVNVASECGLTPQYEQLQAIYKKYEDKGFVVLGFPCNQFGKQEPGTAQEIQTFCRENYGVTFDMFSKVEVNGSDACDLYKYLTALDVKPKGKGKISWNFEKFLVGRDGKVVARFAPPTKPDAPAVISAIESQLAEK